MLANRTHDLRVISRFRMFTNRALDAASGSDCNSRQTREDSIVDIVSPQTFILLFMAATWPIAGASLRGSVKDESFFAMPNASVFGEFGGCSTDGHRRPGLLCLLGREAGDLCGSYFRTGVQSRRTNGHPDRRRRGPRAQAFSASSGRGCRKLHSEHAGPIPYSTYCGRGRRDYGHHRIRPPKQGDISGLRGGSREAGKTSIIAFDVDVTTTTAGDRVTINASRPPFPSLHHWCY
jgi:hypothetical protein